MPVDRNLV